MITARPSSASSASPRSPNSSRSRIPPPPWRDGIVGAPDRQSAFQSGEFKMRYVRMPIEVESPEEYGYGKIRYNLSERSIRSEEHTSELQSLMRISYAAFCLKTKKDVHIKIHKTQ